jgi:flagellar biosynthesis protein FlhG
VGKTTIVANLAYLMAKMDMRVLVLDADMGLANIDLLLGLSPIYTLKDFLDGSRCIREILLEGPSGMRILPAGSGVWELTHLNREQRLSLMAEINALRGEHDVLLIDTAAGVSSNVLHFNAAAEEVVVLVTPEPTSITIAYALIKLMSMRYRRKRFLILVNESKSEQEAKQVFQGLNGVVERFLQFSLTNLGFLPWDAAVGRSIRSQRALVELFPEAKVVQRLQKVALQLRALPGRKESFGEITLFGPYA